MKFQPNTTFFSIYCCCTGKCMTLKIKLKYPHSSSLLLLYKILRPNSKLQFNDGVTLLAKEFIMIPDNQRDTSNIQ